MPVLNIETEINAAPEICFDLIRAVSLKKNLDIAADQKKLLHEIILGETVEFENKFIFFTQKLIVKVTELEKPIHFTDEMIEGNFKIFKHTHKFLPRGDGTLLRDSLIWTSPFGTLGKAFDRLFLSARLHKIVTERNIAIKQIAEKISK